MAYEISGTSTELCSCNAPCPCAFGQEPTGGKCAGIFAFDIQGGGLGHSGKSVEEIELAVVAAEAQQC